MKCQKCGNTVTEGDKFCENCGALLENMPDTDQTPGGNYNGGYNGNYNYNNNNNNYNSGANTDGFDTTPMTMKEWLITDLLMMIPFVGIIMCFVWAFSSKGNLNRRNFCRATLIVTAIAIGVVIVLEVLIATITRSPLNDSYYY